MEEVHPDNSKDIDITDLKGKSNDYNITDPEGKSNDCNINITHCDEWNKICRDARMEVRKEISEYKLGLIQNFLFGGPSRNFGDAKVFVIPALIQAERFMYVWMTELSEESRKAILNYTMYSECDNRMRDYYEYLKTPVWKYTSSIVKILVNYTCARCGMMCHPSCLNVCHVSFEHLGSELNHLDDLTVLCRSCHMIVPKLGGKDE